MDRCPPCTLPCFLFIYLRAQPPGNIASVPHKFVYFLGSHNFGHVKQASTCAFTEGFAAHARTVKTKPFQMALEEANALYLDWLKQKEERSGMRPRCPECGEDTTLPPSNAAPNKARIQNAICSLARSLVRVCAVCMRG